MQDYLGLPVECRGSHCSNNAGFHIQLLFNLFLLSPSLLCLCLFPVRSMTRLSRARFSSRVSCTCSVKASFSARCATLLSHSLLASNTGRQSSTTTTRSTTRCGRKCTCLCWSECQGAQRLLLGPAALTPYALPAYSPSSLSTSSGSSSFCDEHGCVCPPLRHIPP
jgi:hypothetical protein